MFSFKVLSFVTVTICYCSSCQKKKFSQTQDTLRILTWGHCSPLPETLEIGAVREKDCIISVPLDHELFVPYLMSLDMFQCLSPSL